MRYVISTLIYTVLAIALFAGLLYFSEYLMLVSEVDLSDISFIILLFVSYNIILFAATLALTLVSGNEILHRAAIGFSYLVNLEILLILFVSAITVAQRI